MNKYFKLHLTLLLIAFTLFISIIIAAFDYSRLKERVYSSHAMKIEMAEDKIIESLSTIDKIYDLMDMATTEDMQNNMVELLELYAKESDFSKWNFQALKEQFEMDVYIIDETNIIHFSSYIDDIGLNFNDCCRDFGKILDERRAGYAFSTDGMDLQQFDGGLKKFAYMPSPDHKYLFELGVSLEDKAIFKKFDFIQIIEDLEARHNTISSIRVYLSNGFLLGIPKGETYVKELALAYLPLLKDAISSGEVKELVETVDGHKITRRYIPYEAEEKRGLSTERAVEIVYNDVELKGTLIEEKKVFIYQLMVILFSAIILSIIITQLISRPIHLAFHDSLTGLKNRTAFEDELKKGLKKKTKQIALKLIDLDNFKLVNDTLGHSEGDKLLKLAATTIKEIVGDCTLVARLGGDEFVVLFSDANEYKLRNISSNLLCTMKEKLSSYPQEIMMEVSISVGIAIATVDDDINSLFEKADNALYQSKREGKNQYTVFKNDNQE